MCVYVCVCVYVCMALVLGFAHMTSRAHKSEIHRAWPAEQVGVDAIILKKQKPSVFVFKGLSPY